MRRWFTYVGVAALAAIVGAAVAAAVLWPDPPSKPLAKDQIYRQSCDSIKNLTPGSLEMGWATEVLSDPQATDAERSAAMRVSLDATPTDGHYFCGGWVFDRYTKETYGADVLRRAGWGN